MRKSFLATAAAVAALSPCASAQAGTLTFNFNGPGVSGAIDLAYGPDTDARYARALVVTSVSGTFSDSNIGISNATIGMLEPRNFATPEPTNLLAPNSFSRFAVATGLPFENHGFLTFDNLFWPGGSLPTASDYQADGGLFDIYGLLFDIGDNRVVDFWGNGGAVARLRCRRRFAAGACDDDAAWIGDRRPGRHAPSGCLIDGAACNATPPRPMRRR